MNTRSFCETVARRAGRIMVRYFYESKDVGWKEDNTPVTVADRRINQHVVDMVAEHYPDDAVLGEEQSSVDNTADTVWVCDPIDGTTPFSHGIPTATFSMARVENGTVTNAVIFDPWEDRLYYADEDVPTIVNGEGVQANQATSLENTVVGFEASSRSPYDITEVETMLERRGVNILRLMSSNYAGMLIASGELTGVIYAGDKPFDGAAVKGVVEGAGGAVTDLGGEEQRYDEELQGYIASNGAAHDTLLDLVATVGPEGL